MRSFALALALLALTAPALAQSSAGGGGGGGGGSANPYPGSDYATTARQDAQTAALGAVGDAAYAGSGNAGNVALGKGQYAILSNLYASAGAAADTAATATGAAGSQIAVLKALRDKLNGTLTVSGAVSVSNFPATQPVSGTVAVSNAFALDATITARLGTLGQKAASASAPVVIASDQLAVPISSTRALKFSELAGTAVSTTTTTTARTGGTAYSAFNFVVGCTTAGTATLYGSDDGFTASSAVVSSAAITANSAQNAGSTAIGATLRSANTFGSYRVAVTLGSAGSCTGSSSFTAN